MRIPSGSTDIEIPFKAKTAAGADATGLSSFTVYRQRNGGTVTAMTTPTVSESSAANMPGIYTLLADEDTTIDAGHDTEPMVFTISEAGMKTVDIVVELYRPETTLGRTLGIESDGDLTKVNTLDGHTPQTGDSFARIGAAGASLTDLGGMSTAMKAEVNTECDTAIADYDPPTKAEQDAAFTEIKGATWATTDTLENIRDEGVSRDSAISTIDGIVDDILVDTADMQPKLGTPATDLAADIGANGTAIAALNDFDPASDAVATVTDVTNRVTANTDQIAGNATSATNLSASTLGLVSTAVNDASATTTSFVTDLTEATNDHYNGRIIIFTSGALANQATDITDYNGSTKAVTVTALTEAPADNDTFVIV